MLTFGIEEEFLVTDTLNTIGVTPPFDRWIADIKDFSLGREAHSAVVESISPVMNSLDELSRHIRHSRRILREKASEINAILYVGGAHPYIISASQEITELPYYRAVTDRYGMALCSSLVMGQHVHIGNLKEKKTETFNLLRPYLPLIIALSANSRFSEGIDSKLSSSRLCNFSRLPRTGIPPMSEGELNDFKRIQRYMALGFSSTPAQFWYDARIHHHYKTIEVRAMDMQHCDDLAVGIACFVALLVKNLSERGHILEKWQIQDDIIKENRWLCIKNGLKADVVNDNDEIVKASECLFEIYSAIESELEKIDKKASEALKKHILLSQKEVLHASGF